jgi:hypothetical protein
LIQERAERWRQEQALTVDVRANLEAEEKRLEAAIERLLDNLEADDDVGLRLKQRRAELARYAPAGGRWRSRRGRRGSLRAHAARTG